MPRGSLTARPCGAKALVALAHARLILHRTSPANVLRRNAAAAARVARRVPAASDGEVAESCAQIGFIIPRAALRLPWRAGCLVQALAGRAMLLRRGTAGTIAVGAAKYPDGRAQPVAHRPRKVAERRFIYQTALMGGCQRCCIALRQTPVDPI